MQVGISKLCLIFRENALRLDGFLPSVTLFLSVSVPTPFLDEFFDNIVNLDYDTREMHLLIYNAVPEHQKVVTLIYQPES